MWTATIVTSLFAFVSFGYARVCYVGQCSLDDFTTPCTTGITATECPSEEDICWSVTFLGIDPSGPAEVPVAVRRIEECGTANVSDIASPKMREAMSALSCYEVWVANRADLFAEETLVTRMKGCGCNTDLCNDAFQGETVASFLDIPAPDAPDEERVVIKDTVGKLFAATGHANSPTLNGVSNACVFVSMHCFLLLGLFRF